jgi:formylmethanofuran dehydrogenase subunit D
MKAERKVYYLRYANRKVPMIRLAGKYLNQFGIEIGDSIKVEYSKGQIIIKKQHSLKERSNHYEP